MRRSGGAVFFLTFLDFRCGPLMVFLSPGWGEIARDVLYFLSSIVFWNLSIF